MIFQSLIWLMQCSSQELRRVHCIYNRKFVRIISVYTDFKNQISSACRSRVYYSSEQSEMLEDTSHTYLIPCIMF